MFSQISVTCGGADERDPADESNPRRRGVVFAVSAQLRCPAMNDIAERLAVLEEQLARVKEYL
jgi:hypothetical protein